MVAFSELYDRRADYVFYMCSRLEMDEDAAFHLNQDVWRRVYRQIPQLRGSKEEHWLCSKIIDSHRKYHSRVGERSTMGSGTILEQALMGLALEDRWPLVLKEFAGFSYTEIGDILNVPEGTVKARIARARGRVRRFREEFQS